MHLVGHPLSRGTVMDDWHHPIAAKPSRSKVRTDNQIASLR
jgi:hypothetical protein